MTDSPTSEGTDIKLLVLAGRANLGCTEFTRPVPPHGNHEVDWSYWLAFFLGDRFVACPDAPPLVLLRAKKSLALKG